jgi:hypothetical protein
MSVNVENATPFATERMVVLDKTGAERLVLVVKATFTISDKGDLAVAEEQPPVVLVDEFRGDPAASSIANEAELAPPKPATDLILLGSARAAKGRTSTVDVTFRVGANAKTVRVFGDRIWASTMGMIQMTAPLPFESIPLVWERAFGGRDVTPDDPGRHEQEPRNPVGVGFRARGSKLKIADTTLPNIEDPASPIRNAEQRVTPQGFGYIGRSWSPRLQYAGTYDDTWLSERLPLLPVDFDERFFNAAPPGLVAQGHLRGGEPVLVEGCTPSGRISFDVPRVGLDAEAQFRFGREPIEMKLDTVVVDTDAMQSRLVFKGDLVIHGKLPQLRLIRVRRSGGA